MFFIYDKNKQFSEDACLT